MISIAHAKASEMLKSSFQSEEDHESIDLAMAKFPTMIIFMSHVGKQEKKKKPKNHSRSIFDVMDTKSSTIECLAAVNYYHFGKIGLFSLCN
jgi:chemotaxis response regulator CheB